MLKILTLFALGSVLMAATRPEPTTLELKVEGQHSSKGTMLVSLFKSGEGFPDKGDKAVRVARIPAGKGSTQIRFQDIPPGKYAVAFVHDENENGKLDTNGLGIPKEGFGFSRDPRVSFGPPEFANAAVDVKPGRNQIQAKLKFF